MSLVTFGLGPSGTGNGGGPGQTIIVDRADIDLLLENPENITLLNPDQITVDLLEQTEEVYTTESTQVNLDDSDTINVDVQ